MADTVRIDETAQKAVADYAEQHGISLAKAATQLIVGNVVPLSPLSMQPAVHVCREDSELRTEIQRLQFELINSQTQPKPVSLDAAAEVMLRHLPANLVEKLRELCREYQVSPAAYLLSYAKLADDRGELSINLAPDDRELGNAPTPLPVPEIAQCAYCKADFKPTRAGQKFCPEPEDWSVVSCGRQSLLDELHKRRPPEAQRKNIAARHPEKSIR